jgi:serine/threonine protein kinase
MEISANLYELISTPASAFLNLDDYAPCETETPPTTTTTTTTTNPPLRLWADPAAQPARTFQWRIDGSTLGGTRFFAIPLFLQPVRPLRTDVCITDPNDLPLEWRRLLQTSSLCYTAKPNPKHPLIHLLLCVLENWTDREKERSRTIMELPFGSKIVIHNLFTKPCCPDIEFDHNDHLEKQWLSLNALKETWRDEVADAAYPPTLDIMDLELEEQLQDSITLVRSSKSPDLGPLVFKSSTNGTHFLYHELQTLLSIPPHANVLGRPLFIVTKKARFGGKIGVCGFILRYYQPGSLGANIPWLRTEGLQTVFGIAIQICSALMHLKDSGGVYCSDLRPDNVILSRDDRGVYPLLIDFEQRGNWYTWSPPEVYHLEHLQGLMRCKLVPKRQKREYKKALKQINCEPRALKINQEYQPRPRGTNDAWNSLSPDQQESATVYMFGKLLWCLFEGVSVVSHSDLVWSTGPDPDDAVEFPKFQRTPECLRTMILDCTEGAPEHGRRFPAVVRKGDVIFSRSGPPSDSLASDVFGPSQDWWKEQLSRSEEYLRTSRPLFRRPCLLKVLEKLQWSRACSIPT